MLEVEASINDADIGRIEVGQAAKLYAEAMPETEYTGTIGYIAPSATVVGNIRTYLVRVTLDNQQGLRDGMSIRAQLGGQQ